MHGHFTHRNGAICLPITLTVTLLASCGAAHRPDVANLCASAAAMPNHSDIATLFDPAPQTDIDGQIQLAIQFVARIEAEAVLAFHPVAPTAGTDPAATSTASRTDDNGTSVMRQFLDRYVYVDPPLLIAEGAGFQWNEGFVRDIASRALRADRPDLVERWFEALAPFAYSDAARADCTPTERTGRRDR